MKFVYTCFTHNNAREIYTYDYISVNKCPDRIITIEEPNFNLSLQKELDVSFYKLHLMSFPLLIYSIGGFNNKVLRIGKRERETCT